MTDTKPQWQRLLDKFRINHGILTTWDFASDPSLACEYRRIMCDLKRKGYAITSHRATPKQWIYRLNEMDASGQMSFVA